jgi:hypothetical protein
MKPTVIPQMLLRLLFVVQAVLGIVLLINGGAGATRGIHVLTGLLFVLCLWAVAGIAIGSGADLRLGAITIVWGFVTLAFGLTQDKVLTGGGHWLIDIAHPLVGIIAIGLAEMLAARATRGRAAA